MAVLQSRSLENIRSGLAAIQSLADERVQARPFVFYGLAKYLIALKRSEAEVSEVIEKGMTALSKVGEKTNEWQFPLLSEIFEESQQVCFNLLISKLKLAP